LIIIVTIIPETATGVSKTVIIGITINPYPANVENKVSS
jgi:hypothetical protein